MCRACPGDALSRGSASHRGIEANSRPGISSCARRGLRGRLLLARVPAHRSQPKSNADYWAIKIETNRARDAHTTSVLQAAGWTVMRFRSHEEPHAVAARIAAQVLLGRRSG